MTAIGLRRCFFRSSTGEGVSRCSPGIWESDTLTIIRVSSFTEGQEWGKYIPTDCRPEGVTVNDSVRLPIQVDNVVVPVCESMPPTPPHVKFKIIHILRLEVVVVTHRLVLREFYCPMMVVHSHPHCHLSKGRSADRSDTGRMATSSREEERGTHTHTHTHTHTYTSHMHAHMEGKEERERDSGK